MIFSKTSLKKDSPKSSHKKSFSKVLWGIFLLFLVIGGIWGFMEYRFQTLIDLPQEGNEEPILFEIQKGSTVKIIAEKLEQENFIHSSWAFQKYSKLEGIAESFQTGRFYLAQNLTIPDVAAKLLNAKKREKFFTIPEGLTIQQIDELITKEGLAESGVFLNCVQKNCDFSEFDFLPTEREKWEGYFFPETYAVLPENFSAELLGKTMLRQFEKRAKEIGILERENLADIVNMASMIEKESRKDDERPLISGILWKRLDEGWVLGVDATVRYFTGKQTEALTVEDLAADNPYNTRKNTGLPPAAICNPGEASLTAAANPEKSSYYYYLHGKDGEIRYATTNAEHNQNKWKYL